MIPDDEQQTAEQQTDEQEVAGESPVEQAAGSVTKFQAAVAALETWVVDHLHNTNISQDTALINRVRTRLEDIKKEIEGLK